MAFMRKRAPMDTQPPKPIYSQEIDAEFVALLEIIADLMKRINMSSKLPEDELAKQMQDTFDAGVRWTRLSEGGYFKEVSEPYSLAFASIVLGMNKNQPADIQKGLDELKAVAQRMI